MTATLIVLVKLFATALMPTVCSGKKIAAKNTFFASDNNSCRKKY
jgi:hypothetical protein